MEKVVFEKLTDVKLPHKAHSADAGIDFYLPESINYIRENGTGIRVVAYSTDVENAICIQPQESVLLPMGIKSHFSDKYMLLFLNRSGMASKKHLFRGACLIDPSYTGEIFVNLTNVSNETQYLFPGEKLIQAVLLPIIPVEIEEGTTNRVTSRGNGGFGSTDTY